MFYKNPEANQCMKGIFYWNKEFLEVRMFVDKRSKLTLLSQNQGTTKQQINTSAHKALNSYYVTIQLLYGIILCSEYLQCVLNRPEEPFTFIL